MAKSAGVIGGASGIAGHRDPADDGDRRHAQQRDPGTEALDDERAQQGAADAAEIERRERAAGIGLPIARAGQHRDDPAEADVVGQQAEEERRAESECVAPELRHDERAHRRA
jgi:hypothetical protein